MDAYQGTNQQFLVRLTSLKPNGEEAPQSTENIVVFPIIKGQSGYNTDNYNPGLTDGRMSKEEAVQFLQSVQTVTSQKFSGVNCCAGLYAILILASLIYLIYWDITSHQGAGYIILSIAVYFFVWIVLFCVLGTLIEKRTKEAIQLIQPTLDANNANLRSIGLRWHLPKAFPKWVELWKDYKEQPEAYPMPNSDPQSNMAYPNMTYPTYGDPNMGQYQYPQQYPQAAQNYYGNYGQNTYENYQGNTNNYYPPQQNFNTDQGFIKV